MDFITRKKHANPEELEYLACQQEMDEQLHDRYCQVERVIRKCSSWVHISATCIIIASIARPDYVWIKTYMSLCLLFLTVWY